MRSVTIVGPDAVMTEGLTKTVFINGPEKGLALVESLQDYDAVIVDDKHRVFFSKGLAASTDPRHSALTRAVPAADAGQPGAGRIGAASRVTC